MKRYAHAIYCDDIRNEIGGKMTLVGIYSGQLLAAAVPCTLPKLCLVLTLSTAKDEPFKSISITGKFSENEVFRMELAEEQIEEIRAQAGPPKPDARHYSMQLMAILSPFQLEHAGKLSLEVLADGERLECAGLEMAEAPPGTVM